MEITAITRQQLMDAIQHVNLVKLKSSLNEVWSITPVLYSTEEGVELLANSLSSEAGVKAGEEVIVKFQRAGFEYLVSGQVAEIGSGHPSILSVTYKLAQRYFNQRKHSRFDTDLKVVIKTKESKALESKAKNISRGGAMILSCEEMDEGAEVGIQIAFDSGNLFKTDARIMRRFKESSGLFGYGIQFIGTTESNNKIINKEISLYESEYLKSLTVLRDYRKHGEMRFDTKISIFSYDPDESYGIREELIKLGAENFEVYHNFRFASEFFAEEMSRTAIIDAVELDQAVVGTVHGISESFPEIKVLLVLPLEYVEKPEVEKCVKGSVSVLYKPLICGEFEDGIIKYLL
ncbi:MAG: PilZ domain-containing protein [Clostridia bacterium]|nr:PilZ domain-containing protein [Clostridia bacterium]